MSAKAGTRCLGGDVATSQPVLRLPEKERFEELLQQRTNLSLATCPELEHAVRTPTSRARSSSLAWAFPTSLCRQPPLASSVSSSPLSLLTVVCSAQRT